MMLTMTKLPPDSFLPTGALPDPNDQPLSFQSLINGHTSHPQSLVSPLVLPRNINSSSSYFDEQLFSLPSLSHRHSSASSAASQQRQQQQLQQQRYLSPHFSSPPTNDLNSVGLSPTGILSQQSANPSIGNTDRIGGSRIASPSLVPLSDSSPITITTEQALYQLRRVTLQNRRLLENWEAERAHLEANRARAEEIYKEERAIMDDDRLIWAEKETHYVLKIGELERECAALRDLVSKHQICLEPSASHRTAHIPRAPGATGISVNGDGLGVPEKVNSPTNGTILTARFREGSDNISPGTTPGLALRQTMPESHPFIPLDPRMQSASPQTSTPGDGEPSCEKVPPIDVQEIHPGLEGIPLRATAVKKSTFTDGKSPSPPMLSDSRVASPTGSKEDSPCSRSKTSPAELIKEALQAPESSRLVMHAGHTPNHSLSALQTAITTNASNTAGSSGASTPALDTIGEEVATTHFRGSMFSAHATQLDVNPENQAPLLEPSDNDRQLKGPLSLRNLPAHDELFLGKVDDKLMTSIRCDNATPTVLKNEFLDSEAHPLNHYQEVKHRTDDLANQDELEEKLEGEDIPLKFKSNNNFGAPLGSVSQF
ncbi:hypothetical protein BX600DRAFT_114185 [Xylariales sp. PMI_506]|nr:hypothetical protein BX600DRAFT_114185 [Xylariales sp. PMI_506]